jgi:hypothetical protein
MDPRSAGAERIAELGWVMIGLAAAVCVVVFGALLYGLRANRQPAPPRHHRRSSARPTTAIAWS